MESNCSVLVLDNSSGFITGQLSWHNFFEEVEFMLLEIKRGYIVIGEVSRGPRLFSRTCWRMVGEEQRPTEGQRLHFVRPGWASGLEVHAQQVLPPIAPPEPSEGLDPEELRHRDSVGPLESSKNRPSVADGQTVSVDAALKLVEGEQNEAKVLGATLLLRHHNKLLLNVKGHTERSRLRVALGGATFLCRLLQSSVPLQRLALGLMAVLLAGTEEEAQQAALELLEVVPFLVACASKSEKLGAFGATAKSKLVEGCQEVLALLLPSQKCARFLAKDEVATSALGLTELLFARHDFLNGRRDENPDKDLSALLEAVVLEPCFRGSSCQTAALQLLAGRRPNMQRLDEVISCSLGSGATAQRALLQLAAGLLAAHGTWKACLYRFPFRHGGCAASFLPRCDGFKPTFRTHIFTARPIPTKGATVQEGSLPPSSAMAYVVPSQLAPISRLMALVWGNGDSMKDSKAKAKEAEKPKVEPKIEKAETVDKRQKEVRIDATTMVPTDLYWSLLRAGERARNIGQHQLRATRQSLSDEQHLVRTHSNI
eukprot:s122_g4.t1